MTRQQAIDEVLSRACTDPIAVAAMREADRWVENEPFDYPSAKSAVRRAVDTVLLRLAITEHPKQWDAVKLAVDLEDYPLELFHQLRRLVHFEYTNDDNEECRV